MVCASVYFVSLLSVTWILSGFDSGFNLAFPFRDSHGVMGFFLSCALDFRKVLDPGEVVSRKSQGMGVEMVFSRNPSIGGWRQENSSRDGEGILRHPILVWFCDLRTGLGEITIW